MRDIGKNIRELRSRAGLSQNELAERLFVTRQTVSNYETGKTRPDVEQILRLAEIFGTDANAVLYGALSRDKQENTGFRTALGGGICVGMTALYFFLRRAADAYVGSTFQILPQMMVTALLRPLMLVSFGWFFMQLLLLALPRKFPQKPWMRRVRWCLLAVLGVLGLLSSFGGIFASFPWLTVGIPAITSFYFDWFSGCIQAFIFCTLTTIFIKQAAG